MALFSALRSSNGKDQDEEKREAKRLAAPVISAPVKETASTSTSKDSTPRVSPFLKGNGSEVSPSVAASAAKLDALASKKPTVTWIEPEPVQTTRTQTGNYLSPTQRQASIAQQSTDFYRELTNQKSYEPSQYATNRLSALDLRRMGDPNFSSSDSARLVSGSVSSGALGSAAGFTGAAGTLAKVADILHRGVTSQDVLDRRNALNDQVASARTALRNGDAATARSYTESIAQLRDELTELEEHLEDKALRTDETKLSRFANAADRMYDTLVAKRDAEKAYASKGQNRLGQIASDILTTGTQMVGDSIANIIPGGGLTAMGIRSFGDASQQAALQGASVGEQVAYGGSVALTEVLTEKMFDGLAGIYGAGSADEQVKQIINSWSKMEGGRKALNLLASFGGESIEEIASGIVDPALEAIYNGKNARDMYEGAAVEIMHDALIGGLLGLLGGGVTAARTNYTETLDAVTKEYMALDGANKMNYKTARQKAAIVEKALDGGKLSAIDINALDLTNAAKRDVFNRATGLQLDEGVNQLLSQPDGRQQLAKQIQDGITTERAQAAREGATEAVAARMAEIETQKAERQNIESAAQDIVNSAPSRFDKANTLTYNEFKNRFAAQNNGTNPLADADLRKYYDQYLAEEGGKAGDPTVLFDGQQVTFRQLQSAFDQLADRVGQEHIAEPVLEQEFEQRLRAQSRPSEIPTDISIPMADGSLVNYEQFKEAARQNIGAEAATEEELAKEFLDIAKARGVINQKLYDNLLGGIINGLDNGEGLQGGAGEHSGGLRGGMGEEAGGAQAQGRSGRAAADTGREGEVAQASAGASREDSQPETAGLKTQVITNKNGDPVMNRVTDESFTATKAGKGLVRLFSSIGVNISGMLGPMNIYDEDGHLIRTAGGATRPGRYSVIRLDDGTYVWSQLGLHEFGHHVFAMRPDVFESTRDALRDAIDDETYLELQDAYDAEFGGVYTAQLTQEFKDSHPGGYTEEELQEYIDDRLPDMLDEEILCDALGRMDRAGTKASEHYDLVSKGVEQARQEINAGTMKTQEDIGAGMIDSLTKRDSSSAYSIDSMAEAAGLTFEKDGQRTVLKDANGKEVSKVTEEMIKKSPLGAVIQAGVSGGFITNEQAGQQRKFFADLYNLFLKTQDIDLIWAVSSSIGFQPIESGARETPGIGKSKSRFAGYTKNSDPQYSSTVDFTTICLKTQQIIDVMSGTMKKLGHGLTEDEIVNIVYDETHKAGEPVPCPVCYVFSRWVGLGGLFDKMQRLQAQYANADSSRIRADIQELERQIGEYAGTHDLPEFNKYGEVNSEAREGWYKELNAEYNLLADKAYNARMNKALKLSAKEQARMEELKPILDYLDNWTWLKNVRLSENYKPVPPEILFDINAGNTFAAEYPESWAYRTSRGPAMGKAATPYADEHLGQILRGRGLSDLKGLGDNTKNPFLNKSAQKGTLSTKALGALQKSRDKMKVQNLLNGQRFQSTSDFRFEYALDYLMAFLELQTLGGKVQLYTKVPEAVHFFASVFAEVNCSLMPKGVGYEIDENGKKVLTFSNVTGMNDADAFRLQSLFNNVQTILVGTSDEHIRLAMGDDRIQFIIPYHASGASESRYKALMDVVGEKIGARDDYSNYQTDHENKDATPEQKAAYDVRMKLLTGELNMPTEEERAIVRNHPILSELYKRFYGTDVDGNLSTIDGKYLKPESRDGERLRDDECFGAFLTKKQAGMIMPFEYWDRTSTIDTADEQGRVFAEYCESLGLHPRFSGWDAKGNYNAAKNFTKESGYWKTLGDRRLYNNDGSYHEQQAIDVTNVNADYLFRDKVVKGIEQPSKVNDPGKTAEIVEKSVARIKEGRGRTMYSVAGWSADKADMNTMWDAQQMDQRGENMEDIWRATGWWKGKDGKWRFEIDDSQMTFHPERLKGKKQMELQDVLDHDLLFQNYPMLRHVLIDMNMPAGKAADGQHRKGEISLKAGLSSEDTSKALIHEIQHEIQDIENFAKGANAEVAYRDLFVDTVADIWKNDPATARSISSLKTYAGRINRVEREMAKRAARKSDPSLPFEYRMFDAMFDRYQSAIGEQEARSTEDRLNMDAAQRAAEAPYLAQEGLLADANTNLQTRLKFFRLHKALGAPVTKDGKVKVDKIARRGYDLVRNSWGWGDGQLSLDQDFDRREQGALGYRNGDAFDIRGAEEYASRDTSGPDEVPLVTDLQGLSGLIRDALQQNTNAEASAKAGASSMPATRYSLAPVEAVEPKTDEWERGATFDEVKAAHPTLFELSADEADKRNPTQIRGTVSSYRKIYDALKKEGFNGDILDASSGLGYGTKAGRDEYGFNVDDIEPFPDASYKPKYTDYSKLDKQYDAIISNAVLNVIPQDLRDAMVVKIGEMLKPGGRAFINVRGDDVKNASSKTPIDENRMEYFIENTGSYQKGFTPAELRAYLQDALGDGFTVRPAKNFGKVSAVVTKSGTPERYSVASEPTYNRTALLNESTVDKYLRDYAAPSSPSYAQAYIAWMTPKEFLDLTTSPAGRARIEQMTKPLDLARLGEVTRQQPFQLRIDHETGEINGHEGRHRASALSKAGVEQIPVLMFDSSNKYDKTPISELVLMGQDFGNSRSTASVTAHDLIPLSYENRDEIVKKFGTQPTLERMNERYNGAQTVRYSVSPETEAEYDKAVKTGDTETEQRLVDEAAQNAGYDTPKLYHGTRAFGFTAFDPSRSDDGISLFATDNPRTAETYSGMTQRNRIKDASYVNADNLHGEQLLAEVQKNLKKYDGYELMTDAQKAAQIAEKRDDIALARQDAINFIRDHDGAFDAEKMDVMNRILSSLTELTNAVNEDELWEAWNKYDSAIWDLKFMDESLTQEFLESIGYRQLQVHKNQLHDFMYNGDIFAHNDGPYSFSYVFDNQLAIELGAELHKGIYELYGKPGRQLVIDAEGSNWNQIKAPDELNLYGPQRTRDIATAAKANGYDSILFKNLRDNGGETAYNGESNVYIFFNPEALKSADPVTYDIAGKFIPLSMRFNPKDDDIRYSISPELRAWLDQQKQADGLGAADAGSVNSLYDQLQAQSKNFHSSGPAPVRHTDVPTTDFQGRNIPKSASTIYGAQGTTDSAALQLEKMIANGELSFDTETDKNAVNKAKRTMNGKGFDGAMEEYRQNCQNGIASKENTALGQQLLLRAMKEGNDAATAELLTLYTRNSTTVAQALQAQSMFRKLSPEGQLVGLRKAINDLNEKYGTDIELTEEEIHDFTNARSQEEREAVHSRIVDRIANLLPKNFKAKFDTIRYLAMLGNPRTHIRNILGNALFQAPVIAKNRVGAIGEAIANAVSGGKIERTKSLTGIKSAELLAEAKSDFEKVKDHLGNVSKFNEGKSVKSEIEQQAPAFANKGLGRAINWASEKNGSLLEAEDMAFKKFIYVQSLAGYLQANGISSIAEAEKSIEGRKLLARARNYAAQEAMRNTFNDRNMFSDAVASLGKLTRSDNKVARAAGYVTEGIVPFKRTPTNILVRAGEYSPIGAANGIVEIINGAKAGDSAKVTQGIDRLAAGLTGSALMYLGWVLAGAGKLRGGEDDDDKQKNFDSLRGHQNYSIETADGKSVTLDWLAPEAIPFFMGAELYNAALEGELSADDVTKVFKNTTAPMLEMSMLQSLNDMFENAAYAKNNNGSVLGSVLSSALTSYVTQVFPTILGQAERTAETERMTTYTDKNSALPTDLQYTLGKISQKIPKWDYNQIPYIDAWGRTKETGTATERALNNFANPAYLSKVSTDAMEDELQRLYDTTGENVLPQRADRKIKVNGEDVNLTAQEYVEYAKLRGTLSYDLVNNFVNDPSYSSLTDEEKAHAIRDLYSYADAKAKAELFGAENKSTAKFDEAVSLGISPEDYALSQATIASLEPEDGHKSVTNMQKYRAIDSTGMSQSEKAAAIGLVMGNEMTTEAGNPSQYAKMLDLLGTGMTVSHYLDVKQMHDVIGDEEGTAAQKATKFAKALNDTPWLTDQQRAMASDYFTYSFGATAEVNQKALAAEQYGISIDDFYRIKGAVDADGNGSMSKAELTAYLNANYPASQRRALFELFGGSKWKNPY